MEEFSEGGSGSLKSEEEVDVTIYHYRLGGSLILITDAAFFKVEFA